MEEVRTFSRLSTSSPGWCRRTGPWRPAAAPWARPPGESRPPPTAWIIIGRGGEGVAGSAVT